METLTILLGLTFAGCGHALMHDWRGALALYEELDSHFPVAMRTPGTVAGPLLMATGAVCAVVPMLG